MRIANWMQRRVHAVGPRDTIGHAREIMEQHRVNQLPVVVGKRVIGIVTDRDLRDAFPSVMESARDDARGRKEKETEQILVESVMTPTVVSLKPSDTVVEAARVMRRERIGSVPIVEDDQLVGILTRSDVLAAFVGLSEIADPARPTKTPTPT
ncbi:MAG: CBS domain-containing protein [Candidatus Binatia bacterium]